MSNQKKLISEYKLDPPFRTEETTAPPIVHKGRKVSQQKIAKTRNPWEYGRHKYSFTKYIRLNEVFSYPH